MRCTPATRLRHNPTMRPCRRVRKVCLTATILALAGSAAAAEVRVARVATPWAVATGVRLSAERDGDTTKLRLEADTLVASLNRDVLASTRAIPPAMPARSAITRRCAMTS